jgi:hypothetical protein
MRVRKLTTGEIALAAEMFGDSLDARRVRIATIRFWRRAFVAGPSLIVWPAAGLPEDFAAAPLGVQAVFVHELTHVWQAQNGVRLLRAKLKAGDRPDSYAYDAPGAEDFARLNIEQQAMVVQHAFIVSRGGPAPHPAELYARAAPGWRRA